MRQLKATRKKELNITIIQEAEKFWAPVWVDKIANGNQRTTPLVPSLASEGCLERDSRSTRKTAMITFTSFPAAQSGFGRPRDDGEYSMDIGDDGGVASKITCPGEAITSSQAYMR